MCDSAESWVTYRLLLRHHHNWDKRFFVCQELLFKSKVNSVIYDDKLRFELTFVFSFVLAVTFVDIFNKTCRPQAPGLQCDRLPE